MPAATEYNPNDTQQREEANKELSSRALTFGNAWNYYRGQVRAQFVTKPGEPNDNVVINLPKQVVDRTVSMLFPAMPTFELEPNDPEMEQRLATLWKRAGGIQALLKLAKYGALGGMCYARMIPGNPVRVAALDPSGVIAFWKADDIDTVLWYEVYWKVGRRQYRQDVVRLESGWAIYDWQRDTDSAQSWISRESAMWPYQTPPIIAWPHQGVPGQFYGAGEVGDTGTADQVNRVASAIARILRFHAAPRTIGIGFETEEMVATRVDGLWTVPSKDAQVFNLEMQTDLVSSMAFLEKLTGNYLQERRTVALAGKIEDFQRVTNLGMRALFIDPLAKNQELQANYDIGLTTISRGLLEMSNAVAVDGDEFPFEVKPHYVEPLPVDPLAQVQQLEAERNMGIVSQETAARERGRDWKLEQERMGQEIDTEASAILTAMQNSPAVENRDGAV